MSLNVKNFGGRRAAPTHDHSDVGDGGDQIDAQDITANNSFTDPSGTTFTGSMGSIWNEDGNSPFSLLGGSVTANLADTYDVWLVLIEIVDTNGNNPDTFFTVNGDTGTNYDVREADGSLSTGFSRVRINDNTTANHKSQTAIMISGRWSSIWTAGMQMGDSAAKTFTSALNENVASPLSSIGIERSEGIEGDFTVRAFGRDL